MPPMRQPLRRRSGSLTVSRANQLRRRSPLLVLALVSSSALADAPPAALGALTLEDAQQRALAISENVQLAEIEVSKSRERLLGAWALVGPTTTLTAQGNVQRSLLISTGDPINQAPESAIFQGM